MHTQDTFIAPVTKRKLRRVTSAWIQPVTHFFHGKYLLNYLLHQTLFICWESKFRVLLRRVQKRKKCQRSTLKFPFKHGKKNALQLLLYQKIWNCAWTNLPSVHRLKRSRQACENSYFHMSSSQSTRVLDGNACLLSWFLSLFHHNEALVFSSSSLRPASSYPLVDRHGMTCRLAVGKLLNAKTLVLDARSMEICDESSLNKNKWIILLLHTISAQLERRRPTQRKIKAYVKTTCNTSVLEWQKIYVAKAMRLPSGLK